MERKAGILGKVGNFIEGFREDYGIGDEDARDAKNLTRELQNKQKESPKIVGMAGSYPLGYRIREALGIADPKGIEARRALNMDLKSDPAYRAGQLTGTIAGDLTQDATRRFYWLLNALQATGEVINEGVLAKAYPGLYAKDPVYYDKKLEQMTTVKYADTINIPNPYQTKEYSALAKDLGIITNVNGEDRVQRGFNYDQELGTYTKRRHKPGHIASLAIPSGIAINTGLGLMTPFGGAEGYKAAVPSEEDPNKTDNVMAEVGLKYLMGRTGNLLPYDEFSKVRPDVSKDEYGRYQAFKYDKNTDMNPLDGDITLPAGAIKYTDEGIHGPEIQFLGRSLPVTTGITPFAASVLGSAAGLRYGRKSNKIVDGFLGGLGGLAVGQIGGNAIEQERRRRNLEENLEDGTIRQ